MVKRTGRALSACALAALLVGCAPTRDRVVTESATAPAITAETARIEREIELVCLARGWLPKQWNSIVEAVCDHPELFARDIAQARATVTVLRGSR